MADTNERADTGEQAATDERTVGLALLKSDFEILKAAHKGKHRYALNGVLVKPDGTLVATDGHRMMALRLPEGERPTLPEDACEFTLPAAAAGRIAKLLPPKRGRTGQGAAELHCWPADEIAPLQFEVTLAADCTVTVATPRLQGHFPPYESVIPSGKPEATVLLDPTLLGETLLAMAKIIKGRFGDELKGVRLTIFEPKDVAGVVVDYPILVTAELPDGCTLIAAVQPCEKE